MRTSITLMLVLVLTPGVASPQHRLGDLVGDDADDPGIARQVKRHVPSSQPVEKSQGGGAVEDIADEEDTDGSSSESPVTTAGISAGSGDRYSWSAKAMMRLELDTENNGPRSQASPGIREDVMALVTELGLNLQIRPTDKIRLQAGGRLRLLVTARQPEDEDEAYVLFNGSLHRTDFEALPTDTFAELSTSWADFRLGMITSVWGANDLVNPNDMLTAKDLRYGVASEVESLKLPVFSVVADLFIKELNISVVWQPVFTSHRVDLFGSDYCVLGAGAPRLLQVVGELAERLADDTVEDKWQESMAQTSSPRPFEDSSVGVRLSGSVGGWDLAAQYFYGFERLPVVYLHKDFLARLLPYLMQPLPSSPTDIDILRSLASSAANAPLVESVYLRQHQVGLSVSKVLWRIVLNGDVSFISQQAEPLAAGAGGLPLQQEGTRWSTSIDTPVLAYSIGGRYTHGEEVLIKLEWWHQLLIDPLNQSAGDQPDLLLGGPHRGGLAFLFKYDFTRVDISLQLLLHSELIHGSIILAPRIDYRIGEHLGIFAGGVFYAGNRGPGALYDNNDQVHLGLRGIL